MSNDDLQLPVTQEATSEIVSSIFSVFCDTELMKLMVEDLQAVGTVPRLVAALTAFRRELGEKADKAVGENAGKEFSSALSQQTAAKLANRLHCHISHAWQQKQQVSATALLPCNLQVHAEKLDRNCTSGWEMTGPDLLSLPLQKSGSLDGSDAAVMQLWRKLKQYGWLHETVASARRVDKVQGMLADISCGIESQKNRSKEILVTRPPLVFPEGPPTLRIDGTA